MAWLTKAATTAEMSVSMLRLDHPFSLPVSRMIPGLITPK